jgi:hypothetical protein
MIDVAARRTGAQSVKVTRLLETAVNWFAVLLAGVIAFVSLGYTFLAYPQTDDLERTGALRIVSMFHRIRTDCLSIEGRWGADLLEYPAYFGGHVIAWYPALLIALMVIGFIGCCCVVSLVMGRRISEPRVIASGMAAYSVLWLAAPFGEQFYWYPAGIEEWLVLALGMILLWLMSNFTEPWAKTLVVLLAFLMPAIQEVFGGWIIGVLAAIWLVKLTTRKKTGTVAAATLASVAGAASNLLMPGVRGRASGSAHLSLHGAVEQALYIERVIFQNWAALLPILIVILLAAASKRLRPSWYAEAPFLIKTLLLFAIVVVPFVVLTMTCYALGGAVAWHTYDGFFLLLAAAIVPFVVACGFDLGQWDTARNLLASPWGSLLRSAALVAALVATIFLPRFYAAFHDIRPAMRNHAVWVQRNAEITSQAKAGVRDVLVGQRMLPLTILPFYFDITEDPNWYANQHLAGYYGLRSLKLTPAVDRTVDRAPTGLVETTPVVCDLIVDSINGLSPSMAPAVIVDRLTVEGWTVISAKNGIAPERVFLTLSNMNQRLYTIARLVPRPDVNTALGQPRMHDSGFKAALDVSNLEGSYTLGISRVYQGKMDSCSQFHPVFFIRQRTDK